MKTDANHSTTILSNGLTWYDLIRLEPHLEALEQRARRIDANRYPSFCREAAWQGHHDEYVSAQFDVLVGPKRLANDGHDHEVLYSEDAADVAFVYIWNAMPPCRNCQHTAMQAERDALRSMPYQDYLQTEHWRNVRTNAIQWANYRCQVCNSTKQLQVHHRDYTRLGCELSEDVIVLCDTCHGIFHTNGRLTR